MEFDEVFAYIGEFELYQVILYFLLGSASFFNGMQNIAIIFIGGDMEHWCQINRLENFTHTQQKYIAIPYEEDSTTNYDTCEYFDLQYEDYTYGDLLRWERNSTVNASTAECNSWVYDQSVFVSTIKSEVSVTSDVISKLYVCH